MSGVSAVAPRIRLAGNISAPPIWPARIPRGGRPRAGFHDHSGNPCGPGRPDWHARCNRVHRLRNPTTGGDEGPVLGAKVRIPNYLLLTARERPRVGPATPPVPLNTFPRPATPRVRRLASFMGPALRPRAEHPARIGGHPARAARTRPVGRPRGGCGVLRRKPARNAGDGLVTTRRHGGCERAGLTHTPAAEFSV
jgi:hypothetical protein